jgi:hypothetical protein
MRAALVAILFICTLCDQSVFAQLAHAQPEWYLPTGDG